MSGYSSATLRASLADAEGLADDQLHAAFAIFAQDADVVGVGDLLRKHILDLAAVDGGIVSP